MAQRVLAPIARRLKELRAMAGMSQQSLAVAAGLSVSLVSQIERGSRSDPRISTTAALAKALGVTLDELVVGESLSRPPTNGASTGRSGMSRA